MELNRLYNMDCMEGMAQFPDKYFDLAIVDPPYGIDIMHNGGQPLSQNYIKWERKNWDTHTPPESFFNELFKVSKDQIIWGGNYFVLPLSNCWLIWDKIQRGFSYSDFEMAWTSFNSPCRAFNMSRVSAYTNQHKIHPTQKPVQLYKWLLKNYAKPDFKIIDTHAGSCSSVIAFLDFKCDWIAFEIDKDYYEAASKRIEIHKQQLTLY